MTCVCVCVCVCVCRASAVDSALSVLQVNGVGTSRTIYGFPVIHFSFFVLLLS